MSDPTIGNVSSTPFIKPLGDSPTTHGPSRADGKDFQSYLLESLDKVNQLQTEADVGVQKLLTGETDNVAEVFSASRKAGVAFDLLMEIRNKLMDAYNEMKQMRV
ncbi:MAG: flagellar hook-basal body complex protein FliE [Planctomycetia bacterium]|jgi:flagellar hook-basal body complex protein FliE|nr:flagellar hook-basal body complex protein FliE [Planctomycetia bacterium]MCC7314906.1 flagellar hook-basal body complex protein FliE [Planctomycetota bacterium]OQZ06988.1 MAG: flagellar hook-basal body complex protein FliE [Planctomycetes bacterium UTPLA1]